MIDSKKELSLSLLVGTAWRYRRHCFLIALVVILSINISFLLKPKIYTAAATIMNIGDEKVGGSNMFQVVGLFKSLNEGFFKFIAIIRSRTFQEQLLQSMGPEFFTPKGGWKGTPEGLRGYALGIIGRSIDLNISPEQSNVLNVVVTYPDPEKAPIIVNQILVDLQKYIVQNSLTRAKRLQNYIEGNIIETKVAIYETANQMANFYKKNVAGTPNGKVENPLQNELIKLSSFDLESYETDPLFKDMVGPLSDKKRDLMQRLKNINIKEIPEQSKYGYLEEEYQILKDINLTLREQYEMAKLDTIKQEPAFQILDTAVGASLAGPGQRKIMTMSLVVSLLASLLYSLYRCFYTPVTPRVAFDFLRSEAFRSS